MEVSELQRRIAELELELKARGDPSGLQGSVHPSGLRVKTPPLFGAPGHQMSLQPADLQRLQHLAGAPPPRVHAADPRRKSVSFPVSLQDSALADLEKEAEEAELGETQMAALDGSEDPMQKILLAQLQQNSVLLKKLVSPKHADPIVGLLSGPNDGASGSGSGLGVKGCLARDAFVRASQDLALVAMTVRRNALNELGYHPSREDGDLLKKYMERRMPLSEHKTLAYMATLVAEGWQTAYASQNIELMGVLGKFMIFLEQAAIDSGKLQMAWLMTGLQEPTWQILVSHRRHPGLQPFTRLAAPSWVSANLAYLKELDFFESRMQSVAKSSPVEKIEKEVEPRAKPKAKAKKGSGKGKRTESVPEAEAES